MLGKNATRKYESLDDYYLACITGALWDKRAERGISREARHAQDEGWLLLKWCLK